MKPLQRVPVLAGALFLVASFASERTASFAPFEEWKAAVIAGHQAALARLYSTDPPAVAQVGRATVGNLDEEWRFWTGLRSSGVIDFHPKVLDIAVLQDQTKVLLRIEAVQTDGSQAGGRRAMVASMVQFWAQQADGWRIVASRRSDFTTDPGRRLPQPATPNPRLYPDPGEAPAQLKAASALAAKENKRVLVVFGGNWCYDCHVLDATFHSREFAPLVDANYVVVHVNLGEEGKDNNDLAARLGVALDRGVPSLAVLDPDGKVVVAQRGGEFESTVKIGPDDVRAFLEKWKPAKR
jgi:ketosteroid isomerase-like protein